MTEAFLPHFFLFFIFVTSGWVRVRLTAVEKPGSRKIPLWAHYIAWSLLWFFSLALSAFLLTQANVLPKYIIFIGLGWGISFWVLSLLAKKRRGLRNVHIALWFSAPIAFFLIPLRWIIKGSKIPVWTMAEFTQHQKEGLATLLHDNTDDLLESIKDFSGTVTREVMVPRTEMLAISIEATFNEIRDVIISAGYSRIPIYEDTIDNIIGILHVKDLFRAVTNFSVDPPAGAHAVDNLRAMLRPTFFVPEVMKIETLMREFQRLNIHLAIAVDEYGGIAGLITLEDILEEIVGEIHDEYDVEDKQFRKVSENKIIADGRVSLDDLEDVFNVRFPKDTDFETIAGFVASQTGLLPKTGDSVTWSGLRFTVKDADERRVGTVEVQRQGSKASVIESPDRSLLASKRKPDKLNKK